jgi:WD40 repeat protein
MERRFSQWEFKPEPRLSPRWSPDGKYIAALGANSEKVVLFNFATRQWTDLVTMPIGHHTWSHNGQYVYFDSTVNNDPAFYRVRISDHKLERVASLRDCDSSGESWDSGQGSHLMILSCLRATRAARKSMLSIGKCHDCRECRFMMAIPPERPAKAIWANPDVALEREMIRLLKEGRRPFNRSAATYAMQLRQHSSLTPATNSDRMCKICFSAKRNSGDQSHPQRGAQIVSPSTTRYPEEVRREI